MNKREHVENRKEEGGNKRSNGSKTGDENDFPSHTPSPPNIHLSSAKPIYRFSFQRTTIPAAEAEAPVHQQEESTGIEAVIGIRSLSSRPVTSTNDIQIPLEQIRDVRLTIFRLHRHPPLSSSFFLSFFLPLSQEESLVVGG